MSLTYGPVHDNASRGRFELSLGDQGVAFLSYRELSAAQVGTARVLALTHAEVPAAARGAGVAAQLVRGTLDLIRSRGERAAARCAYVVDFVLRHPEYADILEN
jgi:predicted GNAT family acetyltransferase